MMIERLRRSMVRFALKDCCCGTCIMENSERYTSAKSMMKYDESMENKFINE